MKFLYLRVSAIRNNYYNPFNKREQNLIHLMYFIFVSVSYIFEIVSYIFKHNGQYYAFKLLCRMHLWFFLDSVSKLGFENLFVSNKSIFNETVLRVILN